MVELLHVTMVDAVTGLGIKFSNGDIMSACTYLLVEAGLHEGDPEQLVADIVKTVRTIIADGMAEGTTRQ